MSGRINASTPWVRKWLSDAARHRVRMQVPDGYTLVIGCRHKPPDFTYILYRDPSDEDVIARRHGPEVRRNMIRSYDIEASAGWFLRQVEVT